MGISLSSGVRNALSSLQSTQAQAQGIQSRLATGKRVNSAVDNPVNFFTSNALNERANSLSNLLDGMSNAIQTIQSASKGLDAITKLVNSAQSTVKQAQNDAAQNRPTKAGTALATQAEVVATNKSLKDIALDKSVVDLAGGTAATADAATASSAGDLGVAVANTNLAISITDGTNTYETSFSATNATVRDVVNEINKSGIATAFVDEKGQLNVKGTGSDTLQVGIGAAASGAGAITAAQTGTSNTAFGLLAADRTTGVTSSGITSSTRSNLISQFNDLRDQIDQLAKDAGYNGVNLLGGDQLAVQFNEKTGTNKSKISIQGTTLSADNLGISKAGNTKVTGTFNFQNDSDLEKATSSLTNALSSLRSLSSSFGANLSVVQARQDFTKDLISTLKSGADNLVLADTNEEGASLLALNTRQQLSQTALSLASQSDQGVLRLFG